VAVRVAVAVADWQTAAAGLAAMGERDVAVAVAGWQ
jgi:hypothetical protein